LAVVPKCLAGHIAAIDAGSNALRLSVARAIPRSTRAVHEERYPLRLGEGVFVRHRFSETFSRKPPKRSAIFAK